MVSMDKKELNKVSKAVIVESIKYYGFELTSAKNEVNELREKLQVKNKEAESVKEMLAGFAGVNLERDDYRKEPQTSKSLSEILGMAISKFYSNKQ